ncbi:parB domain-containing protein [Trichonephila clavata]|uniref:ParB domain-containing protein n=2 Tax=Trichonephila clavata TaxID=2740835 RepID=A0A8X6GLT6_TRICU|nr:parB domain-containing protein [Trichonephila clavata]
MNLAIHYYPTQNLVEYERNPRKNDDVVNRMCASIREFGFRIPIVAKSDGTVIDGHLRLKAARKLGMESIPVVLSDNLSDGQTKAFRLLANQSANWAKWDDELLKVEIQELEDLQFDLKMTGFELEKVQRFLDNLDGREEQGEKGEKFSDLAGKVEITKPGDLWILGGHRIYCGDSCLVESFKAVLDDKMADITVCDPPYNVAYGDSQEREDKKILNDDQGEKYELFLYDICSHILAYTKGAIYICASSSELSTLQKVFEEAGGRWSTFIIWAKNHFTLGRSDYQRQYEAMLYGWKSGNKREWHGGRNQSDLWFYDKPTYNSLHPTMKPVELMERAIVNSSRPGDIVLDPFSGSGSTLIACERTGRICRTIELDSAFVDVTIKRWQVYTGREAILSDTGKTFAQIQEEKREQANEAVAAIRDPSQPLRRKSGERGNTSELSTMLLKTRIKNEMERGKLLEAKAKAEIGELISVEEVKTEAFNVARVVRNNLLNIPDRVSALLASINDTEKIHETLTEEIRTALEELVF